MIPKVIHYCWFGHNPLPPLAKKCIKSWKKHLPDYEIKEWNEDNFDINIIPYVKEAYNAKKYAFVSDYARFWILYHYGGLYFDTDVEIIRPIDHIVTRGAFMGCEDNVQEKKDLSINITFPSVAPGLGLGCNSGHELYKEIIDYYESIHFKNPDGSLNMTTVVKITTNILLKHGLKCVNTIQECAGITIYPKDFFCPISWKTGETKKTTNTVSIHHFAASWLPLDRQLKIHYPKLSKKHPKIFYYFVYLPRYEYAKWKNLIIRHFS